MVIVHERRHGADLDRVRVVGGVLEETVIRVEELPGDQEEELPGGAAVVQPATQEGAFTVEVRHWKITQVRSCV